MSAHVFVDESKECGYYVAAAVVAPDDLSRARQAIWNNKAARDACLSQLVDDLAVMRARRLVLKRDDAALRSDNALLYARVRALGIVDVLCYDHLRAHEECLLAIPDAIAWSWVRGGPWRTKVRKLVTDVRQV